MFIKIDVKTLYGQSWIFAMVKIEFLIPEQHQLCNLKPAKRRVDLHWSILTNFRGQTRVSGAQITPNIQFQGLWKMFIISDKLMRRA